MFASAFSRLLVFLILMAWVGSAADAPLGDPRAEYRELLALSRAELPLSLRYQDEAKIAWFQRRKAELHGRGGSFLERYTTHPLRWDVLVLLRYGGEERVKISRSGFHHFVPVPESWAAWNQKYFAALESLLEAFDASSSARDEALRQLIDHTARQALAVPVDALQVIPKVRTWLDRYEKEFPRSRYAVGLYHSYANLLDAAAPDLCVKFLAELEGKYRRGEHLDNQVQELVAGHRRALEAQALPVDELWQFLRELDPVVGDGARYRGKVVLVAIGPVTYDTFMESLEDLYAQYAEQGLVILQVVSFSRAVGLPPEPAQRRDLGKVLATRRWPWPVLWNPKGHLEFVQKWGFNTIPARMLIGRDGRLVPDRNTPFSVSIPRELVRTAEAR